MIWLTVFLEMMPLYQKKQSSEELFMVIQHSEKVSRIILRKILLL